MSYIQYEKKNKVDSLNMNIIDNKSVSVFPSHIYSGNTVQPPYYLCFTPRNTETHYMYGVEKDSHPDHFSRFSYGMFNACRNGYCQGNHNGRYIVSEDEYLKNDYQPPNLAPDRFYKGRFQYAPIGRDSSGDLVNDINMKNPYMPQDIVLSRVLNN